MRHGNKRNHLGRKKAHVESLLSNLASSLILKKRINTTVAKAKALKSYVEPIITKSKADNTHSRRVVFSYLQNKEAVTTLFRDVAVKVADRKGGYTRIIKTGVRLGDKAEMCLLELVDFNELYTAGKASGAGEKKAKTTRRSRSSAKKKEATTETNTAETKSE